MPDPILGLASFVGLLSAKLQQGQLVSPTTTEASFVLDVGGHQ